MKSRFMVSFQGFLFEDFFKINSPFIKLIKLLTIKDI